MAVRWSNELRFYAHQSDLSTATTRASVTRSAPALDKTGFGDAAESSIGDVQRDSMEWAGWFDDGTVSINALIAGTILGTVVGMVSFLIGTATGNRSYSAPIFTQSVKPSARIGELVQVVGNFKPDKTIDPCRHFGILRTVGAVGSSGSIDDTAATTGTHRLYAHVITWSGATTGTVVINLADSATGTTFVDVTGATAVFTGNGSTVIEFTGTLRRYVRASYGSGGGTFATSDNFVAYRRSG